MKKVVFYSLLVILCGLFCFSGWKLRQMQSEYTEAAEAAKVLTSYISIPEAHQPEEVAGEEEMSTDDTLWPQVDFEGLQQLNSDVIAWICLEDTVINYPIVQGADNNQYLRRLLDGTWNTSGTLFLDCDNDSLFSDQNSVIYGHNMRNKTMFGILGNYKEQEYYDAHPVALLMTPGESYKIRFFSGYVADLGDNAWELSFTEDEYGRWLEEITAKSCFVSEIAPTTEDRVVTLSTCSKEFEDARFVLHGIIESKGDAE